MNRYVPRHLAADAGEKDIRITAPPGAPSISKKKVAAVTAAVSSKEKKRENAKPNENEYRLDEEAALHDIDDTEHNIMYMPSRAFGYVPRRLADEADEKDIRMTAPPGTQSISKKKVAAVTAAVSPKEKKRENAKPKENEHRLDEEATLHDIDDTEYDIMYTSGQAFGYVPRVNFGNDFTFDDEQEKSGTEKARERKNEFYLYMQTVLESIVAAFMILTFVISISMVIGASMEPTLLENDRLVILRFFYKPSYGDIIAVWAEGLPNRETGGKGEMIVKRVIGLEGDVIDIDRETGTVYRNGKALKEDYIKESIDPGNLGNADYPVTVDENSVFVLGDNRNHSTDSRYVENADTDYYVGCIDLRYIMGKAVFRIYPLDRIGVL